MTTDNPNRRQPSQAEIEAVTSVVLPEPVDAAAVPRLDPAAAAAAAPDPATAEAVRARMAELDLGDSASVVRFGSRAQAELQQISQAMLADVKNKDVGPAGESLREIVSTIRGFSVSELDPARKRSLWERITGRTGSLAKFVANYEAVQSQIDRITDDLLQHEHRLLKDIKSLDLLYDRTLGFYDELALYIAAGEARLAELDQTLIPDLQRAVDAAPEDSAVMRAQEYSAVMRAQELRDLRALRDDLERRVHDLRMTRQVTMQSLPSIRLVQENDKSLVTRINSTLVNTVPLWETQLAQAVTIQRGAAAAGAVKEATDLTNDLLTANARNLRQANAAIRAETERGVFDIAAVRTANAELIATIEDSLRIADEGRARRVAAEAELAQMEGALRNALAASQARRDSLPPARSGAR